MGLFAGRSFSGGCSATRLDGVECITHKVESSSWLSLDKRKWWLM